MSNHLKVVPWLVAACNPIYMLRTGPGSHPYMEIRMPIYGTVQWHNSTPSEKQFTLLFQLGSMVTTGAVVSCSMQPHIYDENRTWFSTIYGNPHAHVWKCSMAQQYHQHYFSVSILICILHEQSKN